MTVYKVKMSVRFGNAILMTARRRTVYEQHLVLQLLDIVEHRVQFLYRYMIGMMHTANN